MQETDRIDFDLNAKDFAGYIVLNFASYYANFVKFIVDFASLFVDFIGLAIGLKICGFNLRSINQ